MNCPPPSKCNEREFNTTKYIVSNCNVIEVTLTQKQNTDCTTEFVSLLDADGNSYPENSEFVSVNNQISRVVIEGISTCASDAMRSALPRSVDYSHKTSAYTATAGYKALCVSFENEGTVNGQYAPAGYSFTHDYFDGGYANDVILNGTSYMVWEGR